MSLVQTIEDDFKQALKDRAEVKVSTLRMLKSALKNQAIELRQSDLKDQEAMTVLRREIKKRQDSIKQFQAGGRADLAAKETAELELINKYLPAPMSAADIEKIVDELLKDGNDSFGPLMKATMTKLGVQADGQVVQQIVKKKLGLS